MRVHQLQQVRLADGEGDVHVGDGAYLVAERRRRLHGLPQAQAETGEPVGGESVEQRLPVGEVAAGRGVGDTDVGRDLPEREARRTALAQHLGGPVQHGLAQVAVVIGARRRHPVSIRKYPLTT
nr:hypothetical protein GCM10025730_34430 [Promicromonospora thailandica]